MRFLRSLTSYIVCAVFVSCACQADPTFPVWTPIFRGIDYTSASCEAGHPRAMKINALRIDLKEKGIRFTTTGRCDKYVANKYETRKVPSRVFLTTTKTQIAINGDFYDPFVPQYISGNTNLLHLAISEGVLVSPPNGGASLLISKDNKASIAETDDTTDLKGVWTAISGSFIVLKDGQSLEGDIECQPRTGVGISKDGRYMYMIVIDGRQRGYSEGATTQEMADWLIKLGAYQGLNLDGGGSTTMVKMGNDGKPDVLNSPVGWGDFQGASLRGRERFVGNNLGVYAQPLK